MACRELAFDKLEVARDIPREDTPSYFKEKAWQKLERINSSKRKKLSLERASEERSLDDMKLQGAKYSQSSGVELKYDSDEDDVDWNKPIAWTDDIGIVKRYA